MTCKTMSANESLTFVPVTGVTTDWTSYTLIVPSVAVANVPQLAVDLLINTLLRDKHVRLAGRIQTPCLRPMTGPNAYDVFSADVSSSCEVYVSDVHKLVALQIRTPPFPGATDSLVDQLMQWITEHGFEKIVVLSSSFAQCLPDPDVHQSGHTMKYFLTGGAAGLEPVLLDAGSSLSVGCKQGSDRPAGCGFGFKLFERMEKKEMSAILILSFCSEGDNRPEAHTLIKSLTPGLLSTSCSRYEEPVSWQQMFGRRSHESEMF